MAQWDQHSRLKVAILVDVDGTLAGLYRQGKRELRASAAEALKLLAQQAPVLLWSIAGAENGQRLIEEHPEIQDYVSATYGKQDFPLHLIESPFAIDDEDIDDVVLRCHHVILNETYEGRKDSGDLLEAAQRLEHPGHYWPHVVSERLSIAVYSCCKFTTTR
jgi:hypothetical protein